METKKEVCLQRKLKWLLEIHKRVLRVWEAVASRRLYAKRECKPVAKECIRESFLMGYLSKYIYLVIYVHAHMHVDIKGQIAIVSPHLLCGP